ncbi:MAG: DNA ligase [Parcubacteria group bacterium ADurb.Bin316]|nr:MAG: DNA ligase [Parcubacteria group bacterium ADurb.Bin316]HOZ56508.1 NAD-dependent DNA ligase LigA [bacterium]
MILSKEEAKKRMEKLRSEINHHRYLYHVLDRQKISDAALDSLKNELYKLEMEYPELIVPDSPTQRVGGKPLDKFTKVKHSQPMTSLFDAFSQQDIKDWETRISKLVPDERLDYYCELKLDGLAMALKYKQGVFTVGATRGDGKIGEDVTQNLKTIESIPLQLRVPGEAELLKIGLNEKQAKETVRAINQGEVEVRGEAIMTKKVFIELNKKYEREGRALLANTRNGAAGSIRQLDSKITAERKLDFYAYALVNELGFIKHSDTFSLLQLLGFKILHHNKYCRNIGTVIDFHDSWEKNRGKLPFEVDGVVVKVNKLDLWPKLGVVGKGPRYMMAYKFAAEQVTTKIKNVVWQVGRTGILTPTAVLEAVQVGGVIVSHATLHNMDEIERLGLKIGDTIIIERAGDVIPKVVQVLPNLRSGQEKEIKAPKKCPMCDSEVVKVSGEVAYRCSNTNCYAINLRRLTHWASKGAIDIDGLGPKIIEQLIKEGLVSDISDFYNLKEGDLKPLERFADKSASNLIAAINNKKEIELAKFIYGLGIRHIGEETAIVLANHFGSLEKVAEAGLEELDSLPDFGGVMARSVYEWFRDKHNLNLLIRLKNSGVKTKEVKQAKKDLIFKGKSVVLTGSLNSLTRDEAKAKIRELGGDISSAVSKKTGLLVVGNEPGSKYDKAEELGIKIINEEEFLRMIK